MAAVQGKWAADIRGGTLQSYHLSCFSFCCFSPISAVYFQMLSKETASFGTHSMDLLLPNSRDNSSIACSHILHKGMHIILKINSMKSTSYKNSREEEKTRTNLWDAFVNHLDSLITSPVHQKCSIHN